MVKGIVTSVWALFGCGGFPSSVSERDSATDETAEQLPECAKAMNMISDYTGLTVLLS